MSDPPLLSVVTPCYNAEQYIGEAIRSVDSQPFDSYQHIVIDGESTDRTVELLQDADGVSFISEEDEGIYDAINKGIKRSEGEFIGLLNADDVYAEGALGRFERTYREDPSVEMITGDAEVFRDTDSSHVQRFEFTPPDALSGGKITHDGVALNACFLSREFVGSIGLFDTRFEVAADVEYLIRIASTEPNTKKIDDIVYRYRQHEGSVTFSDNEFAPVTGVGTREMVEFLPRYLDDPKLPASLESYCRRTFRVRVGMLLRHHLRERDVDGARRVLRFVAAEDPYWFAWCPMEMVGKLVG